MRSPVRNLIKDEVPRVVLTTSRPCNNNLMSKDNNSWDLTVIMFLTGDLTLILPKNYLGGSDPGKINYRSLVRDIILKKSHQLVILK